MDRVTIGLDLGTSGLRALALAPDGRVLARARRGYPTARPEPDAAEQSVESWWGALVSGLREVAETVDPRGWCAIGLSAMLPTLVSLSGDEVVGEAITWEDGRAEDDGARFAARCGAERLYRVTGQRVDGRYLLPMHARLLRLEAEGGARLAEPRRTVAGAKDYLFLRLTGELLTDPSTAAGFGAYDLAAAAWDTELLDAAGRPRVPEVAPSTAQRSLRSDAASAIGCPSGIPVVLGAADSVLGAYGLGAVEHGAVAYVAGTSTVILGHSDTAARDPQGRFLVTPAAREGFGLEMDLLATGAAYAWLGDLVQLPGGAAEVAELASTVPPTSAPTFLPYLSPGEQGALWDPSLTGTIHGATLRTGRPELARALQTAIILESRRCIRVLDETFGLSATGATGLEGPPGEPDLGPGGSSAAGGSSASGDTAPRDIPSASRAPIAVSGSSASSEAFRQELADATGRRVAFQRGEADHSAIGAALLAAHALGIAAARPGGSATETVDPVPGRADLWAALAHDYDALRESLTPVV